MNVRGQLHGLWPDRFTQGQSAKNPSEELVKIEEGDECGWPNCDHDPAPGTTVLASDPSRSRKGGR